MELLAQTVDLWWIDLTLEQDLTALRSLLDEEEKQRASRFRQPHHQHRFIVAHGQLRQVLASYANQRPETLRFCRSERGKPAIVGREGAKSREGAKPPLEFNLSHSGDVALVGVCHNPVGVDVEQVRPLPDSLSMAQRFFSVKEFIFLKSLNEADRARAFLRHWVCKEAYVKATGEGLVEQLNQVVVNLEADSVAWHSLPQGETQNWQLQRFGPTAQTVAAVVVRQSSPLQCRWFGLPVT